MDDTLLYIPPCCVDTKLPMAIMQTPRQALNFYTHGDVPMEKFYRAVSYLVQDPHVMVLSMTVLSHEAAAFLSQCFERGWITDLVLSTAEVYTNAVDRYLSDYRKNIIYNVGSDVSDDSAHMVLYSNKQALTLNGPMWNRIARCSLASYTLIFYASLTKGEGDWGNPILNATLPDALRSRRTLKGKFDSISSYRLRQLLELKP